MGQNLKGRGQISNFLWSEIMEMAFRKDMQKLLWCDRNIFIGPFISGRLLRSHWGGSSRLLKEAQEETKRLCLYYCLELFTHIVSGVYLHWAAVHTTGSRWRTHTCCEQIVDLLEERYHPMTRVLVIHHRWQMALQVRSHTGMWQYSCHIKLPHINTFGWVMTDGSTLS